jgi:hypothetical protein
LHLKYPSYRFAWRAVGRCNSIQEFLSMAITNLYWWWQTSQGNGYATTEIDIPPATVGASVAVYGQGGGGPYQTGIKSYRRRLPDGSDQNIDFGEWYSWPPVVWDFVSSVVFANATGQDEQVWAVMRMDWWE